LTTEGERVSLTSPEIVAGFEASSSGIRKRDGGLARW
jgi:hypothetical protein